MNEQEIRDKIIELGPWFHQFEIAPNVRTREIAPTPGPQHLDHPMDRWKVLRDHLPSDMTGMRVLDIGCADGFFAIEMAKRGAEVLAIDNNAAAVERVEWTCEQLGITNVTARTGRIENLVQNERYDLVFFIAVLYHLVNPLLGLQILARMTDRIFLETTTIAGDEPYMYFKPPQAGVHGVRKWFPTESCVEEMLDFVGFKNVEKLPDPSKNRATFIGEK